MNRDAREKRAIQHGLLFLEEGETIRSVCNHSTTSKKSTVNLDLQRLERIDPVLYKQVREKLDHNRSTRHLRGGVATKQKYERLKEEKKNGEV